MSRKTTNKPRVRDKVWTEEHGNGEVVFIDWAGDREVVVMYHGTPAYKIRPRREAYEYDDFIGKFSDAFGGTWML